MKAFAMLSLFMVCVYLPPRERSPPLAEVLPELLQAQKFPGQEGAQVLTGPEKGESKRGRAQKVTFKWLKGDLKVTFKLSTVLRFRNKRFTQKWRFSDSRFCVHVKATIFLHNK